MIQEKIKSRAEIEDICTRLRKEGETIGFTSGAFDIFHAGHADYLEKAKMKCGRLVVGVNSDESVARYKGLDRPINPLQQRMQVVAALESVDYVFPFGERRNRKNIEAIKPHFYIKAGDYTRETLTSAGAVEEYGGCVLFIPIAENVSTSGILQRLSGSKDGHADQWVERENTVHIKKGRSKSSPALFVDRDGTINKEVLYLHDPNLWEPLPGALEGVRMFQNMGYKIVIITNQPGIGMGYFPEKDFYAVNRAMLRQFSNAGIMVDKIYFCPHSKADKCSCRKPGQLLVQRAREELNLDLEQSVMIGDKSSDIETGKRAGMKTVLVKTGFKGEDREYSAVPDFTAESIKDAADQVLSAEQRA